MKTSRNKKVKYRPDNDPVTLLVKEAEIFYDANGKEKKVILPYKLYERLMARIEDAEDNRLMDEVKKEHDIPWNEAKKKSKSK